LGSLSLSYFSLYWDRGDWGRAIAGMRKGAGRREERGREGRGAWRLAGSRGDRGRAIAGNQGKQITPN